MRSHSAGLQRLAASALPASCVERFPAWLGEQQAVVVMKHCWRQAWRMQVREK